MRQSSANPNLTRAWRDWLVLAAALVLAGGMVLYSQWVMVPAERARYAAMGQPVDVGDLYPRWYGARELLRHHRDPYSLEVSREIQVAYYGHALDTEGVDRGRDEQRFAYPVYVAFFLAPTLWLQFPVAQMVVRLALAILLCTSVLSWLRALRWRPTLPVTLALLVFSLSSPAMVQALRLQQLAVLVGFFLAVCAALASRGRLFWAGCCLAGATIKPQLALFPVLLFLFWVSADWKRRQGLAWGFSATLGLLMAAGQMILPGWLPRFVEGLIAYGRYVKVPSLLDFYLTPSVGRPLAVVALSILVILCYRGRRTAVDEESFFYQLSLVLAVTVIALPLLPPFNQLLVLPGILGLICVRERLWERGGMVRGICCLGVALLLSCWFMAGVLALMQAVAPQVSLASVWTWPFFLSFGVPPIVAGLLLVALTDSGGAQAAHGST